MSAKGKDPRGEQTRRKIIETFKQMMDESSFEEISITDIVTRSGINRSTFYDYFQDKFQLVIEVFIEIIFLSQEPHEYQEPTWFNPEIAIQRIERSLINCQKYQNISKTVYTKCHNSPYFRQISDYIKGFHLGLQEMLFPVQATIVVPDEVLAHFCNAGFNYLYLLWIQDAFDFTPHQMAVYTLKMNILTIASMKGIDPKTLPIYNWDAGESENKQQTAGDTGHSQGA